jgi:hypothetical protein
MQWRSLVAALTLAAAAAVPVSSATPEERAAARQAVEAQIRDLETRLAALPPNDAPAALERELAGRWVAAARELLKLGNPRAAGTLAGHARRMIEPPAPAPSRDEEGRR